MRLSRDLHRNRHPVLSTCLLVVVAATFFATSAHGQEGAGTPSHPMLFGLGLGDTGASSGRVYDVRMPFAYTIISPEDRPWGLRLRLIVYAGIYDFLSEDVTDFNLRFQSLAATPGIEFLIPLGQAWTLKPFTEIGYARDFENALNFGIWSFGMRTLTQWQARNVLLSFGTRIQYSSSFESDLVLADDYGELEIGLDAGFPLGFTIKGNTAYFSTYGIRRQYVNAFIARPEGTPLEVEYHNEIGVAFGTHPKIKLWFVKLPRIGIGYRWGPKVDGFRLSFGFPF